MKLHEVPTDRSMKVFTRVSKQIHADACAFADRYNLTLDALLLQALMDKLASEANVAGSEATDVQSH